ncbi:MAG: methionyl-tRNA formyltransferase, partial [Candidatus Omnitrophica bacterium]|nr:methionyl-tRNA formyltransferase [Candidatus Omnitrophota bacterium]
MNIVFFGSSEFSIPVLSSLLDFRSAILVITIPPKRKGRGQRETKSVVSDWARSRSIRCIAPDDIRASSFIEALKKEKPD